MEVVGFIPQRVHPRGQSHLCPKCLHLQGSRGLKRPSTMKALCSFEKSVTN